VTRRSLVSLSLLLACLCAAPAEAAVTRPYRATIARSIGGAAAVDGAHLVAWGAGGGQLALYDDRSTSKSVVDLGRPCASVNPLDGSAGIFLINCGVNGQQGVETRQLVYDSGTGDVTDLVDNTNELIGRYWVQGTLDSGGRQVVIYTNWHTGETRSEDAPRSGEVRTPFDLDSPNLDAVAPAATEFVVGSSLALEQVRSGRRRSYSIHLMGRMDDRRLSQCSSACIPVSLKGGLALWANDSGTRLFGYRLRSGGRVEWNIPDVAVVRGSTTRRVYYLTPKVNNPQFFDLRSFGWR
jgi:hypothetical protein